AGRENCGAVLERDAEDPGAALGGEAQFVAEGGGAEVARGCADREGGHTGGSARTLGGKRGGRKADHSVALVLDRSDSVVVGAGGVPPFVGFDAVAVSVSAGADGC